jgi:sterol desaturase/sphingolipid hydroxylase (fatty acid hydroxylase superfamily)
MAAGSLLRSRLVWPGLLTLAVLCFEAGSRAGHDVLTFNLVYLGLAALLLGLERLWPHERAWLTPDGQMTADLSHTALNKIVGQILATAGAVTALGALPPPPAAGWWPQSWPLAAQVALGLVVAEFGLYWAHRLSHEVPLLWRFHAIHHSTTKLWVVNTGRFHVVDSLWKSGCALAAGLAIGAPHEVVLQVLVITTFIGLLTHCNIAVENRFLSRLFNTPDLHRWHHSRRVEEGNRNYGENLILWDLLFGTYLLPVRRPPADIGCDDPVPAGFLAQLAHPFRRLRRPLAEQANEI